MSEAAPALAPLNPVDLCRDCGQFVPPDAIHACVTHKFAGGDFRARLLRTTTSYRPYRL